MNPKTVKHISEFFVKPQYISKEMLQPYYLTSWELGALSVHYMQRGILYTKPAVDDQNAFMCTLLDKLKQSLSLTLVHFYPLAGRLKTIKSENPHSYVIFVDLNDSPGAKLIHASLDMTVSDIVSPTYVPLVVQSLFDHNGAINHDGHTRPLVSIQVTDLVDGIFMSCSMNHALADGTSYWNFFQAYSEIFQAQTSTTSISRPPIVKRWFPDGHDRIISLPYTHQDEFLSRYEAPQLLERCFHFTAESIAKLKARANLESKTSKISSFLSLSALVWRSITRARCLPKDETTSYIFPINDRSRLEPPLSENYFGACVGIVEGTVTAGELVEHNLGWAALKLHQIVVGYTSKTVLERLDAWQKSPVISRINEFFNPKNVVMGGSPRFNCYGIEFGLDKVVTLLGGRGNKVDGKVSSYPGREGGGSIDLEICLIPDSMHALESDEEFMSATS